MTYIIWYAIKPNQTNLLCCGLVSSPVWLYHRNIFEKLEEKVRWRQHKNAKTCFKQILKTASSDEVLRLLASYLTNHSSKRNKTSWARLEK